MILVHVCTQQETGFSWSNVIGMVMQLLFNSAGATGPSKSDAIDPDQVTSLNFHKRSKQEQIGYFRYES